MSKLNILERRQLEELLEMGGGYVLDFSNRTLEDFVFDSVGVDIYDERYHHGSGSKANRLRGFWKIEGDALVAKLIGDLVDYAEFVRKDGDPDLIAACRSVSHRLLPSVPTPPVAPPISALPPPTQTTKPTAARPVEHSNPPQPIRVFISYSWDNQEHKDWVREFADALATNGIGITLDQYDLRIGDDRFQFMESSVRDSDSILCICTPPYVTKANDRSSGVGVETSLITPQFYEKMNAKQFIPIVRKTDEKNSSTPDYLSALIFVDFRDDLKFKDQMEELLRHLHNQPKYRKPKIGPKPSF